MRFAAQRARLSSELGRPAKLNCFSCGFAEILCLIPGFIQMHTETRGVESSGARPSVAGVLKCDMLKAT
jgi:hypothetical protein